MGRFPLLFVVSVAGCLFNVNSNDEDVSDPTPTPIKELAQTDLPEMAQFSAVGSVGRIFELEEAASEARFPTSPDVADRLLPDTIRLFRFDEQTGWAELPDSSYDVGENELVGTDLSPGLYSAFGWSANPVENVMQRLILDAQLGYDYRVLDALRVSELTDYDQTFEVFDALVDETLGFASR